MVAVIVVTTSFYEHQGLQHHDKHCLPFDVSSPGEIGDKFVSFDVSNHTTMEGWNSILSMPKLASVETWHSRDVTVCDFQLPLTYLKIFEHIQALPD